MNRNIGIAIILNILNLLDLVLTLIGTQMPHIDFINIEQNTLFVSVYSEFLVGNWIPILLAIIVKILAVLLFTFYFTRIDRHWIFTLLFSFIFSIYSVSNISWILLIFKAEPLSQLAIDLTIICLFVLSLGILHGFGGESRRSLISP